MKAMAFCGGGCVRESSLAGETGRVFRGISR